MPALLGSGSGHTSSYLIARIEAPWIKTQLDQIVLMSIAETAACIMFSGGPVCGFTQLPILSPCITHMQAPMPGGL